jgi:DUF917 family protein
MTIRRFDREVSDAVRLILQRSIDLHVSLLVLRVQLVHVADVEIGVALVGVPVLKIERAPTDLEMKRELEDFMVAVALW